MDEIVITPSGPDALEAGLMVDDTGTRFVVLTFKELGGDPLIVTFAVPLFQSYMRLLNRTAEAATVEANWTAAAR